MKGQRAISWLTGKQNQLFAISILQLLGRIPIAIVGILYIRLIQQLQADTVPFFTSSVDVSMHNESDGVLSMLKKEMESTNAFILTLFLFNIGTSIGIVVSGAILVAAVMLLIAHVTTKFELKDRFRIAVTVASVIDIACTFWLVLLLAIMVFQGWSLAEHIISDIKDAVKENPNGRTQLEQTWNCRFQKESNTMDMVKNSTVSCQQFITSSVLPFPQQVLLGLGLVAPLILVILFEMYIKKRCCPSNRPAPQLPTAHTHNHNYNHNNFYSLHIHDSGKRQQSRDERFASLEEGSRLNSARGPTVHVPD